MTETVWPAKRKIHSMWPFTWKGCQLHFGWKTQWKNGQKTRNRHFAKGKAKDQYTYEKCSNSSVPREMLLNPQCTPLLACRNGYHGVRERTLTTAWIALIRDSWTSHAWPVAEEIGHRLRKTVEGHVLKHGVCPPAPMMKHCYSQVYTWQNSYLRSPKDMY